jgi:hypothetical protein
MILAVSLGRVHTMENQSTIPFFSSMDVADHFVKHHARA